MSNPLPVPDNDDLQTRDFGTKSKKSKQFIRITKSKREEEKDGRARKRANEASQVNESERRVSWTTFHTFCSPYFTGHQALKRQEAATRDEAIKDFT